MQAHYTAQPSASNDKMCAFHVHLNHHVHLTPTHLAMQIQIASKAWQRTDKKKIVNYLASISASLLLLLLLLHCTPAIHERKAKEKEAEKVEAAVDYTRREEVT